MLTQLAQRGRDLDTRAKATLGLAQLELAGGHCKRAKSYALRVVATAGVEPKTARRAHDLLARCDALDVP
jgi:hypothetical protein